MKNFVIILIGVVSLLSCAEKPSGPIRILTAGIAHESNTFNPILTTTEYFNINRGAEILADQQWANYLVDAGVEVIPTLHTNANPFGVVSAETYGSFKLEIINGLKDALAEGDLHGIYLDMHGALHVEGLEDAQVDLVKSIREIVGEKVLIAGSFDLHGNMSQEFVDQLDILTAYRTAPHVDGMETRLRAVKLLHEAIAKQYQPVISHIKVPILIPGEKGITSTEPLRSLYAQLQDIAAEEGLMDASIFVGMPWTDVKRAGMSIQVVAESSDNLENAELAATRLAEQLWSKRHQLVFDVPTASIEDAVQTAVNSSESTVFITDSGDNTTAGAAGDNTLVLKHLLSQNVKDAVVAGIVDPEAVKACEIAGVGAEVSLTIGGKLDTQFGEPLEIHGAVRFISSGNNPKFPGRKPVVIESEGVLLVLLNQVRSFTTVTDFEEVNINPLDYKIVVVKLGYLFPELREIAPTAIMALTPGFANQVIENLPYQNISRPIYPLDKHMHWEAR